MKENLSILLFTIFMSAGAIFFYCLDKLENFPIFVIGCITLSFGYYAYLFSKEKFRLDLLSRRWKIYKEILKFCSIVSRYGGLPKYDSQKEERSNEVLKALQSAGKSFRGMGLHESKSLFDQDIINELEKINKHYSFFITYNDNKNGWNKKDYNRLLEMSDIIKFLPELFKPYIYFGNYKN